MLSQVRHQFDDHLAAGLIDQLPTFAATIEQAGLLQGFQMERQRRQWQTEMLTDLAGGLRSHLGKMAENPQAGVLRKGAEYSNGG